MHVTKRRLTWQITALALLHKQRYSSQSPIRPPRGSTQMAPTRVLILGATGGCGKHALSNLLDRGVQCVAVVRSEEAPAGRVPR